MKENMADYIGTLSGHDIKTLETIISQQYKKFVQFYWLMKKYTKSIKSMSYEFISPTSLDVDLSMSVKNIQKLRDDITESMNKNAYTGEIKTDGKTIHITITLDESMVP